MAFSDDLEQAIEDIRQEAIHRYGWELPPDYKLTEDKTAVRSIYGPNDAEAVLTQEFRLFRSYLTALEDKLASFSVLDPSDLYWITSRLGRQRRGFADGSPGTVIERLEYAEATWITPLMETIERAGDINSGYGYWSGPAATSFNNHFLAPYRAATGRQRVVAEVICYAAETFRLGVKAMQDDILMITEACLKTLKGERGFDPVMFFTAVGMAATAVGMAPALPFAATFALGATSLTASVAALELDATARKEAEPKWEIDDSDAQGIVISTFDAIAKMQNLMAEEDVTFAQWLQSVSNEDPGSMTGPEVVRDPSAFGQVNSTDPNVVVAEVTELYKTGHVHFPAAAAEVMQADSDMNLYETPVSVSIAYPFSRRFFDDLRWNLSQTLVQTNNHLVLAGHTLVTIAMNYEWSDAGQADRFRELVVDIDPAPQPWEPHRRPTKGAF